MMQRNGFDIMDSRTEMIINSLKKLYGDEKMVVVLPPNVDYDYHDEWEKWKSIAEKEGWELIEDKNCPDGQGYIISKCAYMRERKENDIQN